MLAPSPKVLTVNTLRIPLKALAESPVLTVDVTANEDDIRPEGAEPVGMQDIRVEGTLSQIDTEYYFEGRASAVIAGPCDRCLGQARLVLDLPVEWYFERVDDDRESEMPGADAAVEFSEADLADSGSESLRLFSGETLDLGLSVWEDLVFSMPSKLLCRKDCKGICPDCGAELNAGPCECVVTTPAKGHPGLAKLKDMYPDLPDRVED